MLEKIRDGSQGVVAKTILVVVILSFALAGIGSYLGGSSEVAGAIVNGKAITSAQVEQEFQQERSRLQQQFGEMFEAIANDQTYMARLRQNALERLVANELLEQTAAKMDLRVGDEQIKNTIRDMKEFQIDGVFNNDRYLSLVRQSGYRVEQFREMMRIDMTRRQLMNSVIGSDFNLSNEASILAKLEQQTRDIKYIDVKATDFATSVEITPEQISEYYDLNSGQFMTQETLSLDYIELKVSDLISKVTVADDATLSRYNENVVQYQTEARRRVSHILFEFGDDEAAAKSQAQAALAQLKGGADFSALAKELSTDTFSGENGGDLDWIDGGMDPEFDKAAYALSKGDMSDVVRSQFGYHIILVTDAQDAVTTAFDVVKADLKQTLLTEAAKELFYEMQQQLADLAFEVPENLDEAAAAIETTVQQTTLFTRASAPAPVNTSAILTAAFSDPVLFEDVNSDVVEITPDHLIVVRKNAHNPSEVKALVDVSDQISAFLVAQRSQELAKEKAQQYLDAWNNGESIDGVSVVETVGVTRSNREIDPAIVAAAFKLAKPQDGKIANELVTTGTGEAIVSIVAVKEATDVEQALVAITARLQRSSADSLYRAFIESLKAQNDIQYPKA